MEPARTMRRSTSDAVTSGKGLKGGHELKRLKVPTSAQVKALTSEQVKAPDQHSGCKPRGGAIALYVFFARVRHVLVGARRHAYARITVCAQTRAGRRVR